jgi:hypothetical protein
VTKCNECGKRAAAGWKICHPCFQRRCDRISKKQPLGPIRAAPPPEQDGEDPAPHHIGLHEEEYHGPEKNWENMDG